MTTDLDSATAFASTTDTEKPCCGPSCCGGERSAAAPTPEPPAPASREERIQEAVRRRYAEAARTAAAGHDAEGSCGCGCSEEGTAVFGRLLYGESDAADAPAGALRASLGCANPHALVDLAPGQVVLDLGSGGGIDVFLAARRVGPYRQGLRPRHDRRDASAGPRQPGRGRGRQRRVLEGTDGGGAVAGGQRRRGDVQLRHQLVTRQEPGARRSVPGASARWPLRRRRRRDPPADARGPRPPGGAVESVPRRRPRGRRLPGPARRRRLHRRSTSRSSTPTASKKPAPTPSASSPSWASTPPRSRVSSRRRWSERPSRRRTEAVRVARIL